MPRRAAPALLVVLVALLACWPAVDGDFVYDDQYYVVENPAVSGEAPVFGTPLGTPGQALWRPLTVASWKAQWRHAGAAGPLRAGNVVLHAAVALALYALARRLGLTRAPACGAALLFAAHPLHAEAVGWVSGRAELLAALGVLLAWNAHLRPGRAAAGLAALLVGLALLCKESAAVAPLLFLGHDLLARRRPPPWGRLLLCALPLVAVYVARAVVLLQQLPDDAPFGAFGPATRVLVAANILGRALQLMLWPGALRVYYHRDEFLAPDAAALATLAAVLLAALALRRRHPGIAVPLLLVPVALATVLNLVPIGATFAERFLYLPSALVCLAAGGALAALGRAELAAGRGPGWSVALPLVALLLALPACRRAVRVLRDDLSIWAHAASVAPQVAHIRYNHGYFLDAAGRHLALDARRPGAADELRASLQIDPDHLYAGLAHQILGNLALGQRFPDALDAAGHYRAALDKLPGLVPARINLAQLALVPPRAVGPAEARAVLEAIEGEPRLSADERRAVEALLVQLRASEPASTGTSSPEGS